MRDHFWRLSARRTIVTVLPITPRPPVDPATAVDIPPRVKQNLGLDQKRSWIVLDEGNRFLGQAVTWRFFDGILPLASDNALRCLETAGVEHSFGISRGALAPPKRRAGRLTTSTRRTGRKAACSLRRRHCSLGMSRCDRTLAVRCRCACRSIHAFSRPRYGPEWTGSLSPIPRRRRANAADRGSAPKAPRRPLRGPPVGRTGQARAA